MHCIIVSFEEMLLGSKHLQKGIM